MENHAMKGISRPGTPQLPGWLRRLGLAGFVFFLAKGMAWLAVPYLVANFLD